MSRLPDMKTMQHDVTVSDCPHTDAVSDTVPNVAVQRWHRVIDWLRPYDFFIAFSHSDGKELPELLFTKLRDCKYRVCIDLQEYPAGADLYYLTKRRVTTSKYLVVVVRPNAMCSQWVYREIEAAQGAGNHIVLVDVQNAFESAQTGDVVSQLNCHAQCVELSLARFRNTFRSTNTESLRIPLGNSSEDELAEVIKTLKKSFVGTRSDVRYRRIVCCVVATILSLLLFVAIIKINNHSNAFVDELLVNSESRSPMELADKARRHPMTWLARWKVKRKVNLLSATLSAEDFHRSEAEFLAAVRQIANGHGILFHFDDALSRLIGGRDSVWSAFNFDHDPTVRTTLMLDFVRHQFDRRAIKTRLLKSLKTPCEEEEGLRQALALVIGKLGDGLPSAELQLLIGELKRGYESDPSASVHSALGWALRQLADDNIINGLDRQLAQSYDASVFAKQLSGDYPRKWFIVSLSPSDPDLVLTFIVLSNSDERSKGISW